MTPKQRLLLYVAAGANLALFAFFGWNALHRRTPLAIALGMLSAALLSSVIALWVFDERRRGDRALDAAVRDLLEERRREEPSHARKKRP